MKKYFSIIVLVANILIISIIFVFEKERVNKLKLENINMRENMIKMNDIYQILTTTFNNFILYDCMDVLDVDLIDSYGNISNIKDLTCPYKLVIYLPEISCTSCTEQELNVINTIFTENEKKRIMVISNFKSNRELKIFEKNSSLKSFGLQHKEEFPSKELTNNIVLFICSESLQGSCVFIPDNKSGKLSEFYYQYIFQKFKDTFHARRSVIVTSS